MTNEFAIVETFEITSRGAVAVVDKLTGRDVGRALRVQMVRRRKWLGVHLLLAAAFVLALEACSQQGNVATMTMSTPEEFFPLLYPPDPVDCESDHFEFANSLRQLPGKIHLAAGQLAEIADFGQPYDWGRGPSGLPVHRFAGAAIGHEHIFVVVEGFKISTAYHDVLWAFERDGAQWRGHTVFGGGATVEEILASICRQSRWRKHSSVGNMQIDCDLDPRGLVAVQYGSSGHRGGLEARPRDKMTWKFRREDIGDFSSHKPPSAVQQDEMLRALQSVRPSMSESDNCRFVVDRFLDALNATR
jgi:hypothetical protein